MTYSESVERWLSCRWGIAFGYAHHQVVAVMDEGDRETYGCMKSEVIDSGKYPVWPVKHEGRTIEIAELHGSGRLSDPDVITSLSIACLGCKFFKTPYER